MNWCSIDSKLCEVCFTTWPTPTLPCILFDVHIVWVIARQRLEQINEWELIFDSWSESDWEVSVVSVDNWSRYWQRRWRGLSKKDKWWRILFIIVFTCVSIIMFIIINFFSYLLMRSRKRVYLWQCILLWWRREFLQWSLHHSWWRESIAVMYTWRRPPQCSPHHPWPQCCWWSPWPACWGRLWSRSGSC